MSSALALTAPFGLHRRNPQSGARLVLTIARPVLAFWTAALVLYLAGLGVEPLRDWDEATYAQVAREMQQSGLTGWFYPTLWSQPFFDKPPLGPGLIALMFGILGESAIAARLPGAVLTATSVPLFYLLAREVCAREDQARWSAAVYLTLLPVLRHGRLAMLDGMMVFFCIVMLLCFLRVRRGHRPAVWAFAAGLSVAMMALTKGMLALPLLGIGLGFLVSIRAKPIRTVWFWAALALGASPALGWLGLQWLHYGEVFTQRGLVDQGVMRLFESVEGNRGTPVYYLLELAKLGWPWVLFLPAGLALAWQQRQHPWARLGLLWFVGFTLLVSIMPTKLPWYIYPAYPALALICGAAATDSLSRMADPGQSQTRSLRAGLWMLPVLVVASGAGMVYFSPMGGDPVPALFLATALLAMVFVVSFTLWRRQDNRGAWVLVAGLYAGLLLFSGSGRSVWELRESYPVGPVAAAIRLLIPPDAAIYTTDANSRPSLNFYSGKMVEPRPVTDLRDRTQLANSYWLTTPEAVSGVAIDTVVLGKVATHWIVRKGN